jgi:hypothetical protein
LTIDIPEPLHQTEDGRFGPCAAVDVDRDTVGQDARDVFEKAAACDVCQAFDLSRIKQRTDLRQE